MNLNDEHFIAKLKERDHGAITLLIERYNETLFKGALKQKLSEDQALEVVQDTWSTFFINVENFQGKSHVRTYLFGILYNKIKETWRSNKKYTEDYTDEKLESVFNEKGGFQSQPTDPADWIQNDELGKVLNLVIEKLPEKQRMAFILKEVEGLESKEICNIIGVSNTNLGVLIYRAKNTLRLLIEKELKS